MWCGASGKLTILQTGVGNEVHTTPANLPQRSTEKSLSSANADLLTSRPINELLRDVGPSA
jgi:hypothetical protein